MCIARRIRVSQIKFFYFCIMFVRKKPNRSGRTSVVVIKKRKGKVCYLKTIGVSSDENEIDDAR